MRARPGRACPRRACRSTVPPARPPAQATHIGWSKTPSRHAERDPEHRAVRRALGRALGVLHQCTRAGLYLAPTRSRRTPGRRRLHAVGRGRRRSGATIVRRASASRTRGGEAERHRRGDAPPVAWVDRAVAQRHATAAGRAGGRGGSASGAAPGIRSTNTSGFDAAPSPRLDPANRRRDTSTAAVTVAVGAREAVRASLPSGRRRRMPAAPPPRRPRYRAARRSRRPPRGRPPAPTRRRAGRVRRRDLRRLHVTPPRALAQLNTNRGTRHRAGRDDRPSPASVTSTGARPRRCPPRRSTPPRTPTGRRPAPA